MGCELPSGQGWLYGIDLAQGTKKFNWSVDYDTTRGDKIIPITDQFLGSPTIIVVKVDDDNDPNTPDVPRGYIDIHGTLVDANFTINTLRSYLYVTEDQ